MNEPQHEPFEFSLLINDVRLEAETVERIGKQLSDMVLSELAKIDLAGTLVSEPLPTARAFGDDGFGGRAGGMFRVD
jgi:hypothetical protein